MQQLNAHQFAEIYKWLGIDLDTLGCIMLDLEPMNSMLAADHDGMEGLYVSSDPAKFWIKGWVADQTPHITLLYGLIEKGRGYEPHIEKVLKGWQLDEVEIDHVGFFESPYPEEPYYCLVAHIKVTDQLLEGHQRLEFLPHINTNTGYLPHMTICYIKKDDALRDQMIEELNQKLMGKTMRVKTNINWGDKKTIL